MPPDALSPPPPRPEYIRNATKAGDFNVTREQSQAWTGRPVPQSWVLSMLF